MPVSYTHLRAHETGRNLVCRLLLEKLRDSESEKDDLTRKVGQLTMQVDWLKKKSEESFGFDWESKFSPKPKGF